MKKARKIRALVAGNPVLWWLVSVVAVAIAIGFKLVSLSEGIQILLMFTLVLVTWSYALETRRIAKTSEEETEASLRPIVLLGRVPTYGVIEDARRQISEQTTFGDLTWLYNVGAGPALNLRFYLKEPSRNNPVATITGKELRALGPGEVYELMLENVFG